MLEIQISQMFWGEFMSSEVKLYDHTMVIKVAAMLKCTDISLNDREKKSLKKE